MEVYLTDLLWSLYTATEKLRPLGTDNENFGRMCGELKSSKTTLCPSSVLHRPFATGNNIFFLKCSKLRYSSGTGRSICCRTSSRLSCTGGTGTLLTGRLREGIAPRISLLHYEPRNVKSILFTPVLPRLLKVWRSRGYFRTKKKPSENVTGGNKGG
jgi:hypothetical protein